MILVFIFFILNFYCFQLKRFRDGFYLDQQQQQLLPPILARLPLQLLFFILGARAMPIYFILGVAMWKLVLILLTLAILPVDWSSCVIMCNLAVLGCYFLYMIWGHGINPIDLYTCIETNPDYYPATASEFLHIRFGQ
jgi:hypothetical protein